MNITIRIPHLLLLLGGVALFSISATALRFVLADPHNYREDFILPYILLSIGIGLLIGAVLGIAGERRKK